MAADVGRSCYVLYEAVVVECLSELDGVRVLSHAEMNVVECLSELDGVRVLSHAEMNVDVSQNHERRRACFCTMNTSVCLRSRRRTH